MKVLFLLEIFCVLETFTNSASGFFRAMIFAREKNLKTTTGAAIGLLTVLPVIFIASVSGCFSIEKWFHFKFASLIGK